MKTYALAIPLGLSVAILAGGLTYCILGGTSYFEKKYASSPVVQEAVEYKKLADELETCVTYMSEKLVADGNEFIIFEKPDNAELKETLKHSLDEITLPNDEKSYTKEIVGLYTELEKLDSAYASFQDLAQKEDYAREYSSIKSSIDSLSDELLGKAISREPNINTNYDKFKSIDDNGAWGIVPTIFGAVGIIAFPILLSDVISDNRRNYSSSRRIKTKI